MTRSAPPGGVLIPIGAEGWAQRARFAIRRSTTSIGRSSRSDVPIPSAMVSRLHAEIVWQEGAFRLVNRSETNQTLLNGVRVSEPRPLASGDIIEVAEGVQLRVELFSAAEDEDTVGVMPSTRRIFAIVHADVAGYSQLIAREERGTVERLSRALGHLRAETAATGGVVVNIAGDALLALHGSVLGALRSCIAFQRLMARENAGAPAQERISFRVGVNAGDVVIASDGNYYGDAINVAARLQAEAPPGGILVSGAVREQLHGVEGLDFTLEPSATREVIARELRTFEVRY